MSKRIKIAIVLAIAIFISVIGAACMGTTYCKPDDETTPVETTGITESSAPTEGTVEPTTLQTETVVTEPPHEHVYTETVVEATCTEKGHTTFLCECGHTYIDNEVEALGHNYVSETVKPTYTAKGYDKHTCSVCGHEYSDNWKDKIPHDCSYTKKVTDPTCTKEGYTTNTCKLCGKSYKSDTTEKVAHKYVSKTTAPTCTEKGYNTNTCSVCGDSYKSDYTDMIAHKYTSKVTAPTCTAKGYTTHTCVCGKSYKDSETDKIPHQYKDTVKAPTCTEEGSTTHTCKSCGHSYTDTIVGKIAHTYGSYKNDNNATCEHDGTETATCSYCKKTKTQAVSGSALGHSLTDWENRDAVHHTRYCTREECPFIEGVAHTYDQTSVVAPTCTEKGYTQLSCVCGRVGGKKDYVDPTGHDYGEVKTVAPTYTSEGYDVQTCKICKHELKSNITPKVPHDCTYKDAVTKPTCTEKGYTTHTCTICSDKKVDTYVDPLGHDYKQKVVAPKCEEAGYTKNTCSRCKHEYNSDEVPATGHDYKTTTVEATTGWGGYDYHKCSTCGHSYKDNVTDKLPSSGWPKGYSDGTCTIIIYKEWYKNAYVYAAHVTFSDYDRLWMECANGKYNSGGETTSHAAKRVGAILAINGDYAVPGNGAGGYAIARKGVVCNDKKAYPEGVYNSNTGKLTFGHSGRMLSELVAEGLVTDTFQFGPVFLKDGKISGDPNSNSRAQRTFIGTNGRAGDIWMCVSDGRYNDGKSAGLNAYECGSYLASKGCTLGIPLDGGGSSTIYFNGKVLNAASGGQRSVVDFLVFK